ncbi:MAG: type II toxin-antitoxin system Phd/YefM family antitoxin [Kiritimatiellae bacterium]|nr:type II toxin-antitoxin system Phd/YefM family antitoxin [Kiritimatiellia bacterium]
MMTVSAYEAKTRLSELLDRFQGFNEEVVICRRGRATVRLVPVPHSPRSTVNKAMRGIVIKVDPAADTESEWEPV